MSRYISLLGITLLFLPSCTPDRPAENSVYETDSERSWLAGDHHIHSRFSVGWDYDVDPPAPQLGGDAIYPIPRNAEMARQNGLKWMVATDHGGPNHSKVSLEQTYPELLESRESVPEVVQFFGMEFDTPGAEHSSLIVPHSHDEANTLFEIEHNFARREPWPVDTTWDTEERMLEALDHMDTYEEKPVLIANHPSRSAAGLGEYGANTPEELRNWNDTAPEVSVGMEGAPGHQASALFEDGSIDTAAARGGYRLYPTMGGFDQMTARLGGFWDSMLGEGRHWWITSTSDSHVNWREGGSDFWPGEYSKTFVFARQTHDDILDGIRSGRVFVTTGDLISELFVEAAASLGGVPQVAGIGETLSADANSEVTVTIRLRDPDTPNARGENPTAGRVDLIAGEITGPVADRSTDVNPTTEVIARFTAEDWSRDGEWIEMSHSFGPANTNRYIRVRGTNTVQLEPEMDPPGEDPWSDLWFYSNPIFISVASPVAAIDR